MLRHWTLLAIASSALAYDYTQHVNPLIGTGAEGHVASGATVPFGMAKPGPDTSGDNNQGGFNAGPYAVTGFSQMHDDGTGGGKSLGNFPIFPMNSCDGDKLENCKVTRDDRQKNYTKAEASPGYITLEIDHIKAELTSTRRVALHRYTFNSQNNDTKSPVLNIELGDLSESRSKGQLDYDADSNRLTGSGTFVPSFGEGTYDLYFCADFKGAKVKDQKLYTNTDISSGTSFNTEDSGISDPSTPVGVLVQFEGATDQTNQLEARVGLSYISSAQACQNAEAEAKDWDFDSTRKESAQQWNNYLSRVEIGDLANQNKTYLELFYSSLYRTMINPQNNTGENPLWDSDEPNYTSFYCIWDIFRTNFPLWSVISPKAEIEMIRSLLDIQKNEGWLPDCRMTTNKGYTQGGSNADNAIADAYLKGIGKDELDWEDLYKAVVRDAEDEPSDWDYQGRGGLKSWKNLNYIPVDDDDTLGDGLRTRSASRTLEYSYNDFCISQIAKGLKKTDDCNKYLNRSHNWKNLWNKDTESLGFKGFIQPKHADGSWMDVDPRHCSPAFEFGQCYLDSSGGEFYEASPWTYSLLASHDYAGLIKLLGDGTEQDVAERLDTFFHKGMQDVGDEIGWTNTFLGHYVGNTSIAADRMREFIPHQFNTSNSGLPGNDDSGAMGAFVVFNMAGFYPNAGQDVYLITTPFFEEINIKNEETGKTAQISAPNLSDANRYIQSAKLNGEKYEKAWISHEFFTSGGHLELEMGSTPSDWGKKDLPPSVSTGDYTCS